MIATLTPKVQWDSTSCVKTPIMAASATMSLSTFPKISGAEPLVRERAPLKIAIGATETTPHGRFCCYNSDLGWISSASGEARRRWTGCYTSV